jgi:hypothetical protein
MPWSTASSDGLACFCALVDAKCEQVGAVAGASKPKDNPHFPWLNTVIGIVKTGLSGTYHLFNSEQYG